MRTESLVRVNGDTPLRLVDAARIAFPGGSMTASGVRRESQRGRRTMTSTRGSVGLPKYV